MTEQNTAQLNARLSKVEATMSGVARVQKEQGEALADQGAKLDDLHAALVGTLDKPGALRVLEELAKGRDGTRDLVIKAALVIFTALVAFVFTAWGQALGITPGKRQAMQLLAPLARVLVPDASAATAPPPPTVILGAEAAEPDQGQAWPPDPSLARAVWVRPAGEVFHVSAGSRTQAHPQYHLTAVGDARRIVRMLPDTTPGAHVYGANSGTVGLALACGSGSTYSAAPAFDLVGGVQPLPQQVEDLAAAAAEVAFKWRLDLGGTRRLANGAVVPVLGTHRDYAVAGGYGADRFDPGGALAKALRSKALWYHRALKRGARKAAWVR